MCDIMEQLDGERDRTRLSSAELQMWEQIESVFITESHLCHTAPSSFLPSWYKQINTKVSNKKDSLSNTKEYTCNFSI